MEEGKFARTSTERQANSSVTTRQTFVTGLQLLMGQGSLWFNQRFRKPERQQHIGRSLHNRQHTRLSEKVKAA